MRWCPGHALGLFGGKDLLEGLALEFKAGQFAEGGLKARSFRHLSAGATETDLPAEPGDVVLIVRPVFLRQLEGGFDQVRRARPANGALVRKNLQ